MAHQLSLEEFYRVIPLFQNQANHPVIFGVIEGNNPGKIFVDKKNKPQRALLWAHTEEDFYLVGNSTNDSFNKELNKLITQDVPTLANKHNESSFNLILCNDYWKGKLDVLFAGKNYRFSQMFEYEFQQDNFEKYKDLRNQIPKDCQLKSIDRALYTQVEDEGGRRFSQWWYSYDLFKEHGLGYVLLKDGEITSTCFACFGGAQAVEIGIVTHPQHLRKGYAFLTAAAFIEDCINNDVKPVWHTGSRNIPSQKLAEKLGFELATKKTNYYFLYDDFNNYYDQAITLAYEQNNYQEAIDYFKQAIVIRKPDRFFYYHYACVLALQDKKDQAFEMLNLFLETLTEDMLQHKNYIISNENLTLLKNDSRWKEFIKKLNQR